ncbi:MAG: hypothetical protein KJ944_03575 [Alphaproteobacteria bacterium]|jgi:hypothetical protein|uniref:hypothetical protein n=1 Tax=Devosia sp. XGJD_8 TaxID=3391187 RepID=UPI001D1C2516|nr:hypothetical protein [Alphaproteobacteria bacterium]MBU1561783.1 hypothetical protein [Alphaproteobacteria bacterium]MBU2301656.1 hypothetical protein [Alphaproteobacteria bacterium]MBU2369812.1 hypothetical protein [Alphaproteobacteria bacterium]
MTQMIDRLPANDELVAIAEKASLYALLQQALRRQRIPQQLPARLYDDLGILPSQRPDFTPRGR